MSDKKKNNYDKKDMNKFLAQVLITIGSLFIAVEFSNAISVIENINFHIMPIVVCVGIIAMVGGIIIGIMSRIK